MLYRILHKKGCGFRVQVFIRIRVSFFGSPHKRTSNSRFGGILCLWKLSFLCRRVEMASGIFSPLLSSNVMQGPKYLLTLWS